MEEEHPEADNRDLCVEVDAAAEAESPEPAVAKCLEDGARLERVHRRRELADHGSP